jgi:ribosomal protein L20A (L18A)
MAEIIVKTYRVNGYYKTRYGVNKNYFEKEIRAISAIDAQKQMTQVISTRKVTPFRIVISKIEEIANPEEIKDRVVRTFATENIRI